MVTASDDQRQHFEQHGYVVARGVVHDDLIASLQSAIDQILDRSLAGDPDTEVRWVDQDRRLPDMISDLLSPRKYDAVFGQLFDSV